MEYRTLTGTGAKVSRLCLGTMTFGAQVDEADSIAMARRALDGGVNFVDTADVYNGGASEEIVGKALKGRRDGVVLASKVRGRAGEHEHKDVGLHRWHIVRGVEASLKRLDVECLDICYFHMPDYDTPLEESLAAADQLVRQGKVIYFGMSNFAAWQATRAIWLSERNRFLPPVVTQVVYNLLTRGIEQEFLPACRELRLGVAVYNPLAGGFLTGKHDPTKPPSEGTRFRLNQMYHGRYWKESNFDAVADLLEIARQAGKTPVQLALQWIAAQPAGDSMIVGASRVEQLVENLAALDGTLSAETLAACDRVWEGIRGDRFQYNR